MERKDSKKIGYFDIRNVKKPRNGYTAEGSFKMEEEGAPAWKNTYGGKSKGH